LHGKNQDIRSWNENCGVIPETDFVSKEHPAFALKERPMTEQRPNPIHMAVYDDVPSAAAAVRDLREAGFSQKEISVLCSDEHRERLFQEYQHEEPAGSHSEQAVQTAGLAALGLGGAAVLTGLLTSAGTAIFAIGAFAGVAALGTFVSLMLTRGAEKELADYYDQAVIEGKILVGVETDDPERQALADAIFRQEGEKPLAMPKESAP
jgi:hypothetical protein